MAVKHKQLNDAFCSTFDCRQLMDIKRQDMQKVVKWLIHPRNSKQMALNGYENKNIYIIPKAIFWAPQI